ncbi:biotin--[acetyl-CoA-carboxylase] ligase [Anaerostipes sp.]|uniref:biotin--[acetyl-CoA-carboxylase] ligase n=1 Tax=Anaerostipes sp. TaxID=1872530 RepID=UPI0025C32A7B|nr:biotin--[acetyl-CoA-carboxylase] ligase [Anaerostipes sp.]MBS7007088.1 biotin--[acetyl-CoA-carboxylase] ligase [Anaerostipes sp.]
MKEKILRELKQQDGYLSGQELCQKFGVSRTAVWKHIKALREEGYVIDSVSNKGYKLVQCPDVLCAEDIQSSLSTCWLGRTVKVMRTVDSTNLEARRLAEQGAAHGTLVTAEEQTSGRGRRGRSWISVPGQGVWMSFVLRPDIELENSSMLTLVAALAVEKGIKDAAGIDGSIKWPNDVLINGEKVCGILTELSAQMDELNYIVVGIGINANIDHFPEEVRDKATSLLAEAGEPVDRTRLLCQVLKHFEQDYEIFRKTEDFSALMDEYNSFLAHYGQEIKVVRGKDEYICRSGGINRRGELTVEDSLGRTQEIFSGEVSIRGIHGYSV